MKGKKLIAVIVTLLFVLSFAVGCMYNQAASAITTNPLPAPAAPAPAEQPEAASTPAASEKPVSVEADQDEAVNVVYISASKLKVRETAEVDAKVLDNLIKGTAVDIIEEKKNDDGLPWYKVSYDSTKEKMEGWIAAEYTVKDRTELLSESLKKLDFSPQDKTYEYPGNPRVEARGIYLTKYSASNDRLDRLIEMTKRTKINTFVIDVKDDNGHMLFPTKAAEKYSPEANKHATVKDISALMKKLKDNNIYTVARIVSFKDPTYTKQHPDRAIIYKDSGKPFTNSDGLIWASAYDRTLWEYNLEVSKEAAEAGFNEIQFDYVRFPASNGGRLDKSLDYRNTTGETKPQAIQDYLKYAREQLAPLNVYISADIYGLVGSVADDMSLGQYWEAVSNVVDYVCPMMYPSHYANQTYGLSVPDAYPYETIYHSAKDSVARNKNIRTPGTIRPWIQDFTAPWVAGYIKYSDKQVEDQIRALEENGIKEYLLWNAGNKYSEGAVAD
ncbi:MAG TPA: putative glycoside hydrolase [Clostridia bacterium]|nr:putative glycoside hydrolase [Clostridia bacterium]